VHGQFDVRVVSGVPPGRSHVETLITGTTVHDLFFAGLRWFRAFTPLTGPGGEDVLEFGTLYDDCNLCVSPNFATLFYFNYYDSLHDLNNVVSWSYQDASFLEAVLFLLRVDTAFEYRDQVPDAVAARKRRDLLGEGSDLFVHAIMSQYAS
jgi:hypothetical protein